MQGSIHQDLCNNPIIEDPLWLVRPLFQLQQNDSVTLRKHAYSNILKILAPKNEKFQIKNSDIFHISAQNIDCGY